jgi:hypothetical protein
MTKRPAEFAVTGPRDSDVLTGVASPDGEMLMRRRQVLALVRGAVAWPVPIDAQVEHMRRIGGPLQAQRSSPLRLARQLIERAL